MQENNSASAGRSPAILVERASLLREGVALILSAAQFDIVVATERLDADSLAAIEADLPSLLILGAGRELDETLREIELFKSRRPDGLVAVLVDDRSALTLADVTALFNAGANTCLSKHATGEVLVRSLELLELGQRVIPQQLLRALVGATKKAPRPVAAPAKPAPLPSRELEAADIPTPPLSAQEKRILSCLVEGHSNKNIARKFEIAEATVKVHLKAILRKIRLQNRTQAAIWALNNVRELHVDAGPPPQRQPARPPEGPFAAA